MLIWGTDRAGYDDVWVEFFCKGFQEAMADWFASELGEPFTETCVLDPAVDVSDQPMILCDFDFFVFEV